MKIGTDIQEVARIKKAMEIDGFINKILLPKEQEYVNKFKDAESHITGFFCAKEAVMKALGDCKKISFKDIEIDHNEFGAPIAILSGEAKRVFDSLEASDIQISISQTENFATAMCVIG